MNRRLIDMVWDETLDPADRQAILLSALGIDLENPVTPEDYYALERVVNSLSRVQVLVEVTFSQCGHRGLKLMALGHRGATVYGNCPKDMDGQYSNDLEASDALGLTDLEGSDKQRIWAYNIRLKAIQKHGVEIMAPLLHEDTAGFWISVRQTVRGNPTKGKFLELLGKYPQPEVAIPEGSE